MRMVHIPEQQRTMDQVEGITHFTEKDQQRQAQQSRNVPLLQGHDEDEHGEGDSGDSGDLQPDGTVGGDELVRFEPMGDGGAPECARRRQTDRGDFRTVPHHRESRTAEWYRRQR